MPADTRKKTICKTVCQYSKSPISDADMQKLLDIAKDYLAVKNYVYQRYGSISSLPKLYPGYTVQNEMTASGLRGELGIPSVYFYLAVFDALGDIKSQWTRTKTATRQAVGANINFTEAEKHYLRFLIKTNDAFEGVLLQTPPDTWKLPAKIRRRHEELRKTIGPERTKKLHRYLCRKVRKYHAKSHSNTSDGFFSSRGTHRYADHGIYITTKERRRRIFIPLTDSNTYTSQIYVKLFPEKNSVELRVAVQTAVHFHADYVNQVGISLGMSTMITTHEGHIYGEKLGIYQAEFSDWVREQVVKYNANRRASEGISEKYSPKHGSSKSMPPDNTACHISHATSHASSHTASNAASHANSYTTIGREKYNAKKRRLKEHLHSYINMELNRFLREEKPEAVYLPKLPPPKGNGAVKKINYSAAMWQRGYIRERLEQKCKEQSVELVKVYAKDISRECSQCGAYGYAQDGYFTCPACGYQAEFKMNAAQNAKKRGRIKATPSIITE